MGLWPSADTHGGKYSATSDSSNSLTGGADWSNPLKRTSGTPGIDPNNFQLQGQEGRRRSLLQQADYAAGRRAPQIGQSGFRQNQQGLMGMLEARARGEGPSVAQMQLKDAMGKNVASQQALLATGGPGAARQASQQAGAIGGSLAGQAAQLRAQEMTQAQGMLGQFAGQARGQDLQRQGMMSDAELRSRGLNDQQIARMRQMELDNARLGLQGSMGLEDIRTRRRGQDLGVPTGLESLISGAAGVASIAG
tara:strand:+ start:20614 stop:21366 length:753 start_codon:yes stop_codon:yes gene_type:complete